ncbi:MAG: hypothetical protein M0T73_01695 [Deltaproteobacteria bacterium]|nr:hypothetical protein [Deltaproteobacteria bacterium]
MSKRRDLVLNPRNDAATWNGKKVEGVWRRDACPGQKHAEPKRELKKSYCMMTAREMKAA